jgi:hypothetical protein
VDTTPLPAPVPSPATPTPVPTPAHLRTLTEPVLCSGCYGRRHGELESAVDGTTWACIPVDPTPTPAPVPTPASFGMWWIGRNGGQDSHKSVGKNQNTVSNRRTRLSGERNSILKSSVMEKNIQDR